MRQLRIPAMLVVFGLLIAACSSGESPGPTALSELPAAEGELNLVIWVGYAEDGTNYPEFDWVTPFEDETGCQVSTTDMTDSANGVELLQSGQYDGGSFSGDATLRLIAGGDVAPVNTDLIPNYAERLRQLKGQPHNSVRRRALWRSAGLGREPPRSTTPTRSDRARPLGSDLGSGFAGAPGTSASTTRPSSSPMPPCG